MTFKRGLIGFFLLAIIGAAVFLFLNREEQGEDPISTAPVTIKPETPEPAPLQQEETPDFDASAVQAAVDLWIEELPSSSAASIYVIDSEGQIIAEDNRDESFFAASIYKLFVAYAGYQQIDAGEVDPDEQYVGSRTRIECLDAMIRESDSPCAETLWNELGKQELTDQLKTLGIENTNMVAISSTAEDAGLLLGLVLRGEGLSNDSKSKYLDSLQTQPDLYRRGLPSGFTGDVTVYNKVGWNLDQEWHDSAIVELEDGRQLVVSVFTNGVGVSGVSSLATALEEVL